MHRTDMILTRSFEHLRAPILAFLVGVGFVVQEPAALVALTPASAERASIVVMEAQGDTALHPASGLATLAALGNRLAARGGHGNRTLRGPECHTGNHDNPAGGPNPTSSRAWSPNACGSLTATAAALFARGALRRSGRLSAPTTAPPVSPF
jgi:hypothetical protein